MGDVILTMKGIDKSFPGVHALDHVDLEVRKGEVHALMGENGAGKSTLMKVLTGIYSKDSGTITFEGREVEFTNPREAQDAGIVIVHQELNMLGHLTVAQNILIGREPGGWFRGFLDAAPRGVFAIASDAELRSGSGQVFIESPDSLCATVYLCMAEDMKRVSEICREALDAGFEKLLAETVECDRRWIANARPPRSRHPFLRKNCKRWLLSNYLLVLENGGTISGVRPFWSFAWPRDCAQQALGFAAAGFQDEAARILEWNFANAPESGVYEARYRSDSSPVTQDNRPRQGDSAGFLCFAAAWLLKHGYDPAWAGKISEKVFFLL